VKTPGTWQETNQACLVAALRPVYAALLRYSDHQDEESGNTPFSDGAPEASALSILCTQFELSRFESATLLLCAGVELDGRFAQACAAALGDPKRTYPTFGLALAALPGAHWSALARQQPLRYWRLLELVPGDTLATSPLKIDERILHFLTGVDCTDERLEGIIHPLDACDAPPYLVDPALTIARIVAPNDRAPRRVRLAGRSPAGRRATAAAGLAQAHLQAYFLRASNIPANPAERENLLRLWNREVRLFECGLYVEMSDADGPESLRHVTAFLERVDGPLIVDLVEGAPLPGLDGARVDVPQPLSDHRRQIWQTHLGPLAERMNGEIDAVVEQFELDASGIKAASDAFRYAQSDDGLVTRGALWRICRDQARLSMSELARRIEAKADWDSLILPAQQLDTLRQIAAHLRGRATVHERWGFGEKYSRGLGITALFAGASGTGKTMSAEVLARSLDLDLYQIDLASTVSKYIGETEKNLKRIFDAAEDSGAILLFDEADSLFGKRTEVKDSHDRYANLEVSYLLQRMESYRGLAILTTNMRHAIDTAFLRRIRFIVSFPFPDVTERAQIWRSVFPRQTPLADLDFEKLARLNVAGGIIRNIATYAAFLAADANSPVQMAHLLMATRAEYSKLERPLTAAEVGTWA
jgi:hypothetical protein